MNQGFWNLNIGQVISAVGILFGMWRGYVTILSEVKKSASEKAELANKVVEMYEWFKANSKDFSDVKAKVELLYEFWLDAQKEKDRRRN